MTNYNIRNNFESDKIYKETKTAICENNTIKRDVPLIPRLFDTLSAELGELEKVLTLLDGKLAPIMDNSERVEGESECVQEKINVQMALGLNEFITNISRMRKFVYRIMEKIQI